ncbi:hypothetical protein H6G51_12080 [Limnothrix sp. FACHB-708]|uniref:hypothetical protein n=1 Tax=unclassified Limnothrix TaxID=2632864 RepID=UPI001689B215|nr:MULTISPECIES: hypothetical protein [unclassified Limnothrix]MBD2554021.1 hypothetical protein [Limnothrix sp. FACHB-708]MBD2591736.1 hypothetical protein [Limnothrix sp. FACHB-406]
MCPTHHYYHWRGQTRDSEGRSTVRGSQTSQTVTPQAFSHSPYPIAPLMRGNYNGR